MLNNGSNFGCICGKCIEGQSRTHQSAGTFSTASSRTGPDKPGLPLKEPKSTDNSSSERAVPRVGRPPKSLTAGPSQYTDEEFTPDTIRSLLDRLKALGTLDQNISETLSMDWLATQSSIDVWFKKLSDQPSWIPRRGELVLFVRDLPENCQIDFDSKRSCYRRFDERLNSFVGVPTWEAGIIGQDAEEVVTLGDILQETKKEQSITYSGFRVEPLPEPNQDDKSLTKRYKYLPMHHLRPFCFWKEMLRRVNVDDWHPTIANAMTVMASVALVGKSYFRGTWPTATVFCRGIFIGSEFIKVGDTVRLAPGAGNNNVTDFLEVSAIRLKFTNLDTATENDSDDGHPYNSSIFLTGKAFTFSKERAYNQTVPSLGRPRPIALNEYDNQLYWLHDPAKTYQVSFNSVLGRCYEAPAMSLWFPNVQASGDDPLAVLDIGANGIVRARQYSRDSDKRISGGKAWYWAETRLEALDVRSLNAVDSTKHDSLREERLEEGQKAAKVLSKPSPQDLSGMQRPVGRPKAVSRQGMSITMSMAPPVSRPALNSDAPFAVKTDDEQNYDQMNESHDASEKESGTDSPLVDTIEKRRSISNSSGSGNASYPLKRSASFMSMHPTVINLEDEDEDNGLRNEEASTLLQSFQQPKKPRVVVNVPSQH